MTDAGFAWGKWAPLDSSPSLTGHDDGLKFGCVQLEETKWGREKQGKEARKKGRKKTIKDEGRGRRESRGRREGNRKKSGLKVGETTVLFLCFTSETFILHCVLACVFFLHVCLHSVCLGQNWSYECL